MATEKTSAPPRALVGAIVAFVSVWALFAQDPKAAVTTVECVAQGRMAYHDSVPHGTFDTTYSGYQFHGDSENLIDWHVLVFGAWEPEVVSAMGDLLELYRGREGVVVDVGANVGTHSVHVSRVAKTVHAIEPWPPVVDRLEALLETNDIKNIIVHPVGFAAEPGEMEYIVPPEENLGKGTFSTEVAESTGFGDSPELMLPLVVGDDYLAGKGVERVDMIKVDIEGFEKMALLGMSDIMRRDKPIVLFEMHVENEEGFHSMEELESVFGTDYVFFDLFGPPVKIWRIGDRMLTCGNPDGVYILEPFHANFETGGGNVLAMPSALAKRLPDLPKRAHLHL